MNPSAFHEPTTDAGRAELVEEIATALDRDKPGWTLVIPQDFRLFSLDNCICSHVYGDYLDGANRIEEILGHYVGDAVADDERYADHWRAAIARRTGGAA
jgi:hypothetical protein